MLIFRTILVIILVTLLGYTALVGQQHGWNLLPIFFHDIAAMNWSGQFNYDFMLMLTLSMLWTMWRNHFSPAGIALGICALFGGCLFLSIYLLILSSRPQATVKSILLGQQA